MRRLLHLALILTFLLVGSCTRGINYLDPSGPRYAADLALPASLPDVPGIKLATFNIKFARNIDRAVTLLQTDPDLMDAEILVLQEMDEPGTERIARTLGMNYVYYPATVHPQSGRDFGNAILSRWPIADDRKVQLPHLARLNGTLRNAVLATVLINGRPIRVYCVHLATPLGVGPRGRRDQVRAILREASRETSPVIIAGDLNCHDLGRLFEAAGYRWPTKDLGATVSLFDVDHIFVRGLQVRDSYGVGIVRNNLRASDHRPVWAVVEEISEWPTNMTEMGARDASVRSNRQGKVSPNEIGPKDPLPEGESADEIF